MIARLEQFLQQPSRWPYQPRPGGKHRLEPSVPVTFIGPRDGAQTSGHVRPSPQNADPIP